MILASLQNHFTFCGVITTYETISDIHYSGYNATKREMIQPVHYTTKRLKSLFTPTIKQPGPYDDIGLLWPYFMQMS